MVHKINGEVDQNLTWPENVPAKKEKEGNVEFLVPESESIYDAPAFFNPVMVLNRDFSLLIVVTESKKYNLKLRVFDPLAGIGVRGFRMIKEINDYISEVVINDIGDITSKIANFNAQKLEIHDKLVQYQREAKALSAELAENHKKYHYIDLDPFGSPAPFIDSIWPTLQLNGIVAITATDMTALCGVYPDACLRKYGAIPLNNHHTHETAARILIAAVVKSAARFERGITPLITISIDHYVKIFFHVHHGRGDANESMKLIGYSYTCKKCFEVKYISGIIQSNVTCCGDFDIAGPLWTGNLFEKTYCEDALSVQKSLELNSYVLPSQKRITKILMEGIKTSELKGYYCMDIIGKSLKQTQPSMDAMEEELSKRGFSFYRTYFRKQSFRSNAPGKEVLKIFQYLADRK